MRLSRNDTKGDNMKSTCLTLATLLALSASLFAADVEPQAQGNATVTVGEDTATWPVWRCAKIVLAHQLPYDDILVDHHVKLIDYGDVIQMVLKLNDKNYVADIPATVDMHDVNHTGIATRINPANLTDDGEVEFTLTLQCNP